MKLQQPISVKLDLVQPKFKCSGRSDVSCTYRSKIIEETEDFFLIKFKYKGKILEEKYYKEVDSFDEPYLEDIKMRR